MEGKIRTDLSRDGIPALFRERGKTMTTLARSILRGVADPADAVASALERLIEEGSDDADRFEKLVYNEAHSLRTKTLRDRRREAPIGLLPDLAELEEERLSTGASMGRSSFFPDAFDTALRGLPDDEREAFIVTELRGLPTREAADVLGTSHMTVHRRAESARLYIREELTT